MKILCDQNVPRPLVKLLTGHKVRRAAELGWAELKNVNLLAACENAGFDLLLSGDKTMRHEQNFASRKNRLGLHVGQPLANREELYSGDPGSHYPRQTR